MHYQEDKVDLSISLGYAFRLYDNRVRLADAPPRFTDDPTSGRSAWDGGILAQFTFGWQIAKLD